MDKRKISCFIGKKNVELDPEKIKRIKDLNRFLNFFKE